MPRIIVNESTGGQLGSKVVVLTGGSSGIGAATVDAFLARGCNVVFGDIDETAGNAKVEKLISGNKDMKTRLKFVPTNLTDYDHVYRLFQTAFETFGRVDIAANIAGLAEVAGWFDPAETVESVKRKPTTIVLDVNLNGTLYFAQIAAVFLKQGQQSSEDKSLTLISSVAGFKEYPGLFVYQASKHGVMGLMRSLRSFPPLASKVRINCVCPSMTLTGMVEGIKDDWTKAGLPTNTPADVARVIVHIASANVIKGAALYVEGGAAWEIEQGLDETQPIWLGEEPSKRLDLSVKALGAGSNWVNHSKGKDPSGTTPAVNSTNGLNGQ
ncbi:hypothetical protein CLAIMM_09504 [Cladophialophora immunda]|nr:hypothetical protein CLAIMM_09504 [Cladophialophora immunda]